MEKPPKIVTVESTPWPQGIDNNNVLALDESMSNSQIALQIRQWRLRLHPDKFLMFAKRLTWCGKQVSKDGLRPSPERVATVNAMPDPRTLSEMMNFVYGIAWFRGHIPHFARIAAPLYDIWKEALAPYKRKTMNNAKRFKLTDIPAWNAVGKEAFERVKAALTKAITTAFFDPEKKTCVYGVASHEFWCLVLTQCEPGVEKLPWSEQIGKHVCLAIRSGRFRHAQLRWGIPDKEGYVFGEQLPEYSHWINGGRHRAAVFTDHHNLLAFYDEKVRVKTCTKPNRQRLTRWGINLRGLRYEIFHISGEENRIADLGSRWGNQYATPGLGGPMAVTKAWLRKPAPGWARSKCMLRLPEPKAHAHRSAPDGDAKNDLVLKGKTTMLDLGYIRGRQDNYRKSRPKGLKVGDGGVWRDSDGKIWVPRRDKQLKNALFAVAHQGPCGHRGKDATLKLLEPHFMWDHLEQEVEARRAQCLQ